MGRVKSGEKQKINSQKDLTKVEFIEIASEAIIDKLKSVLDQDVAVTDLEGNIVADSEMKYFGKHVPAARESIRQNQTVKVAGGQLEREEPAWVTPLVYDKQIIGSLIIKDAKESTQERIPLARSLAELLIHQVMVLRLLPESSQVLDKFFHDLLEEQGMDREKLLEQSRFLDAHYYQTRLESDRIVLLVNIRGFWQKVLGPNIVLEPAESKKITEYKTMIADSFRPLLKNGEILVTYFSGDNFVVLVRDTNPQQIYEKIRKEINTLPAAIKAKIGEEIKIVLPPFYPGISGLIKSYQEAKTILDLGRRLSPQSTVYLANDVLVPQLISQIPLEEQKEFVNHYLDGILNEPPLLSTLSAYFAADLNLKETARSLNIHKNTLYYRFEKIRKQIGLDPRSFHNAVKLSLALLIHQLTTDQQQPSPKNVLENKRF